MNKTCQAESAKASCPACKHDASYLGSWLYSGLNDSVFNYTAFYFSCNYCGMLFIDNITEDQLTAFYSNECDYAQKDHFDANHPKNVSKFEHYHAALAGLEVSGKTISDVGCGRGGFIRWLAHQDSTLDCVGVDIDLASLPTKDFQATNLRFENGFVNNLPFENGSVDVITCFHVLEHLKHLDKALSEIARTLKDSGYLLLEVPDAERYEEFLTGPDYWFAIREHINHFTPEALSCALESAGFEICEIKRGVLPTPEFEYPSLMIMAKKASVEQMSFEHKPFNKSSLLPGVFKKAQLALIEQADRIKNRVGDSQTVLWGCSNEFYSLVPLLLKHSIDVLICDASRKKQQARYQQLPIHDPKQAPTTGKLVVVPYLYSEVIYNAAIQLGWQPDAIYLVN